MDQKSSGDYPNMCLALADVAVHLVLKAWHLNDGIYLERNTSLGL